LSTYPCQRRRAQNRASQRAFRHRRDQRVKELEGKLEEMISQYENLTKEYTELSQMHNALKEKKEKMEQCRGKLKEDSIAESHAWLNGGDITD
jgi:hypothetical protein